jgi:dolichol-phosphate mannosyltransferase
MQINFSIVIPVYNESKNIVDLLDEINFFLIEENISFEIIIVNDSSTDNSEFVINQYMKKNSGKSKIKLISNKINQGQSYSIREGIKIATYDTIVTIDGDGQNNPKDINKLLKFYYFNKHLSLVGGLRKKRQDNFIKILSSKIANFIRKKILDDDCNDTGCSLKVFDKKIFLKFPYFSGMHRFLPALFKGYGCKTHYLEVDHRKRLKGHSKYGTFDRLFRGIRDLFVVIKIIRAFSNEKLIH